MADVQIKSGGYSSEDSRVYFLVGGRLSADCLL
jgi:hypothetical protein